jgi:broad specificity phosphatase PhoE
MPKTIHCIRHGQSTFNAHWLESKTDPMHVDARLSELGHRQVAERAPDLRQYAYELIVTSPLTRAIQTTEGLFKDHPGRPPLLVEPLHRECLDNSCDVGRARADLLADFPHLNLDHLSEVWWHDEGERDERGFVVEPVQVFERRVEDFREWLRARPESLIAVVGHGTFFRQLTGQVLNNCEVAVLTL